MQVKSIGSLIVFWNWLNYVILSALWEHVDTKECFWYDLLVLIPWFLIISFFADKWLM